MRTSKLIVALALALAWANLGHGGEKNRITSIDPECAERGVAVTITGTGFGARSVRVFVGELPATVQRATGKSVTFIVPRAAPLGETLVTTAQKNGHQSGRIRFRVGCDITTRDGVLLQGEPGSPALDAVADFDVHRGVPSREISLDSSGRRVARTRLEIAFTPSATVAEVNALLEDNDARIVSMLEHVAIVVVEIPDPGTVEALEGIAASLRANPIVRFVLLAGFPETSQLPPNHTGATIEKIDHHLAVRGHAAWNARAALHGPRASEPVVVVFDLFGDGAPGEDIDAALLAGDFGTGDPQDHGYHVLGIIAARFGGEASAAGLATGMFPSRSEVRVVDFVTGPGSLMPWSHGENIVLHRIRETGRNVVLNTSLNSCDGSPCVRSEAERSGSAWIEKVRGTLGAPSLESKFLHFASAGNIRFADDTDPGINSSFAAARLLHNLVDSAGNAVPNLTNTLVIENRLNTLAAPVGLGCLSTESKRPGDLSAIGTDVYSLTAPAGSAGSFSGTSMASPQAAGLGAFVWALRPDLSPQQVMSILGSTARMETNTVNHPFCDTVTPPRPAIDAYAAVLATDGDLVSAPVRLAILDVADGTGAPGSNGAFDEHDVAMILSHLRGGGGVVDYSRFDLNGDGRTGGAEADRFDLDVNQPPAYSTLAQSIGGVDIAYDERSLTDKQILCYYAYSSLFSGNPVDRDFLLGGECVEIRVSVTPESVSLRPGQTQRFTATVQGTLFEDVTWSATGADNAIFADGTFLAGSEPGTFEVRATSDADPSAFGTATAHVTAGERAMTAVLSALQASTRDYSVYVNGCDDLHAHLRTASALAPPVELPVQAGGTSATLRFSEPAANEILLELSFSAPCDSDCDWRYVSALLPFVFEFTRPGSLRVDFEDGGNAMVVWFWVFPPGGPIYCDEASGGVCPTAPTTFIDVTAVPGSTPYPARFDVWVVSSPCQTAGHARVRWTFTPSP